MELKEQIREALADQGLVVVPQAFIEQQTLINKEILKTLLEINSPAMCLSLPESFDPETRYVRVPADELEPTTPPIRKLERVIEDRSDPIVATSKTQRELVHELMLDGFPRTVEDIRRKVGGTDAGITSRLREMRENRFGGFYVGLTRLSNGRYEYWVRKDESEWG